MGSLPTGTVTFLFTDIEGSTRLAQKHPEIWEKLRERHHAILQSAIEEHKGYVFQIIGDAFCVAFHTANDALSAALNAQRGVQYEDWGETPIKVRMGLHTGSAEYTGSDYRGYLTMAKVQRVMSVAYGGQILLSNTSAELLRNELPDGVLLRDMQEHRLKGLSDPERLWQAVAPDLQADFPALSSLSEIPNNLPLQLKTFIGREKEIDRVKKRLEKNRLVTLTGSGGVGKTRLSIQVASELLGEFPHGVILVELAPIADPALVTRTVCAALDITTEGNLPALQVLTEYLRLKKTLLVIDNCEHLIESCAQLCDSILHACPQVRMIASSREALGIEGENAYRVPSLSLPNPNGGLQAIHESEAVRLFLERATAILPEFEITEANSPVIAQICQRLDGIALAIELAASRLKILKVEQIASRLDDAFRILTGGSRTALPRQQTLRAMIDWSYNLLSEEERIVLRRLSVFMGGWTLEAAEAVCDHPNMLDLLTHLVDKSLVAVDLEHGDEPRYYLLETIRQYAREKLADSGEAELVRERHTLWYVELAERAEPKLCGSDQLEWVEHIDQEIDNVRAAMEWSFHHDFDLGLRITNALARFWVIRDHQVECIQFVERLLVTGVLDSTPLHARSLGIAAWVAISPNHIQLMVTLAEAGEKMSREVGEKEGLGFSISASAQLLNWRGNNERARQLFEESMALLGESGPPWGRYLALGAVGYTSQDLGDYERANAAFHEALTWSQQYGDLELSHFLLSQLGRLSIAQGNYELGLDYFQKSLSIARIFKNNRMQTSILQGLAEIYIILRRFSDAEILLEESISIERDMGNPWAPVWTRILLGRVARLQGNYTQSRNHYLQALQFVQKNPSFLSSSWLAWCLAGLAELFSLCNQPKIGAQLFGAADAIPELRINLMPHEQLELERLSRTIRNQLDEAAYAATYEVGKRMSRDDAVAYSLKEIEQ
jgi:predicted ATPase/class 3 adenylate cyclase/tetratricopeptide (TPR) repeat protein